MISRGRTLVPRVHLPLRRLALCIDCDAGFEIGSGTCPACGSKTWTSLSRFLEQATSSRRLRRLDERSSAAQRHDEQPEMVRQVIIVARNREQLYERLKRAFAGNATVRVVLDRRVAERRERSGSYAAERRQGDRRSPLMLDELLRAIGWVVVPQDVPKKHRGSPR
jgi:predicted amidophosphoribosyltransferase